MSLVEQDEALQRARDLVAKSPADETEVTLESTHDSFVRFADVGPTQSADRERVDVAIRVRSRADGGYREARASVGSLDEAELARALDRALAICRESPVNTETLELPGPVDVPRTALDRPTLEHGFEAKAEIVRSAVAACASESLQPAGLLQTSVVSRAIANSAGRAVHGYFNRAGFALTASGERGSGIGESISRSAASLDAAAATRRAVEKARRNADPQPIAPGEYTVVLEPSAVSSILLFASYYGFGAREVDEEASFLCGRIGEDVFAAGLSITDDAQNDVYPGMPFDGEGTPRSTVKLIDAGRLTGPVTDRYYARKMGLACTGHAPPQPSPQGPAAGNLVVSAGDRSLDELIGGVERGLLVSQFHYTNMIEPREMTLTGMTRNGTFLIENGALVTGVRNLRFTESLVRALARVSGIGSEREVTGALFDGEIVTPALRVEGFRFTSSTDF